MVGVDFHGFFGQHVGTHGGVSQGLGFHDSFHVGAPSEFSGDQNARWAFESLTELDFFNFFTQNFLKNY